MVRINDPSRDAITTIDGTDVLLVTDIDDDAVDKKISIDQLSDKAREYLAANGMDSNKLTGLVDGTDSADAVTKNQLDTLDSEKQNIVSSAVENNVASFDSAGQIKDSGFSSDDLISEIKTVLSLNSGPTDSDGNADILSYSGNTVSIAGPITLTNYQSRTYEISTVDDIAIPTSKSGATYNLFVDTDGSTEAYTQAIYQKDLFVDFSQANANDNYGLHTVTEIGSPTYTGNKFNSNGDTGLEYDIESMGTGSWCVLGQVNFSSTGTAQTFVQGGGAAYSGLSFYLETTGVLEMDLSSAGSSWDIGTITGTTVLSTSTDYYVRAGYDSVESMYYIELSTDYDPITQTGTWINEGILIVLETIADFTSLRFGIDYDDNYALDGTLNNLQLTVGDNETSIKTI